MKNKFNIFLKFVIFSLSFFVLSRGFIAGQFFPFSVALLYSLAWANQKVWILCPSFLIGSILNNYSFEGIICSLCTICFLLIPYFVHLLLKKNMKKWEVFLLSGLSQSASLIFSFISGSFVFPIINVLMILICQYLFTMLFEAVLIRGLNFKLSLYEVLSLSVLVMAFANSLSTCDIYGFSFLKLFVFVSLLILNSVAPFGTSLLFASLAGVGVMLRAFNPIYISPFLVCSLILLLFRTQNKILPSLALVLSEGLNIYAFSLYQNQNILQCVPVVIACLIYFALPKNFLKNLNSIFACENERLAIKSVVNRNRDVLERKIGRLSEVFFDMNQVFRKMIKQGLSPEQTQEMLYDEIKMTVCKGCSEQKHCHRTFGDDTKQLFKELIMIALSRGKITLLDVPSYLASRCGKTNYLINEINTLASQYKSYSNLVGNVDTSKLLISDQLAGIGGIMKSLAGEVGMLVC